MRHGVASASVASGTQEVANTQMFAVLSRPPIPWRTPQPRPFHAQLASSEIADAHSTEKYGPESRSSD